MSSEKLHLVKRLETIDFEIKVIESNLENAQRSFHTLGLLRQESMDIQRRIKKDNLIVLLLKLATIDSNVWNLIELSKIKPLSEHQIDEELFDNML
jgi:hypothetical protein